MSRSNQNTVCVNVPRSRGRQLLAGVCSQMGVHPDVLLANAGAWQTVAVIYQEERQAWYWRRARAAWLLRHTYENGRPLSWSLVAGILKLRSHTAAMRAADAWQRAILTAAIDEMRREGVL